MWKGVKKHLINLLADQNRLGVKSGPVKIGCDVNEDWLTYGFIHLFSKNSKLKKLIIRTHQFQKGDQRNKKYDFHNFHSCLSKILSGLLLNKQKDLLHKHLSPFQWGPSDSTWLGWMRRVCCGLVVSQISS